MGIRDSLRERVIALAKDHADMPPGIKRYRTELALAVLDMTLDTAANEIEGEWEEGEFIADAIRKLKTEGGYERA